MIWKITTTKEQTAEQSRAELSWAEQIRGADKEIQMSRRFYGRPRRMLLLTVALTLCFPCFSVKSHLLPHPLRPPRQRAARAFSTCQRKGLIGISRRVSKSFSLPLCIFFCPVSLFQWGANTSRPAHTHTLKQTSITWEKPNPNAQSIEVS